jgi:hypothetical protein
VDRVPKTTLDGTGNGSGCTFPRSQDVVNAAEQVSLLLE